MRQNLIFFLILFVVALIIRKVVTKSKLQAIKSETEKVIKSAKTQSQRDSLKSMSLLSDKTRGKKLSKEDEKWLQNHVNKSNIKRKKSENNRLKNLIKEYGSETGELIYKGKVGLGMTTEMVIDCKGRPTKVVEKISGSKKREEYFYGAYKNRQGNESYKFRVVLINGKVNGWNDITN